MKAFRAARLSGALAVFAALRVPAGACGPEPSVTNSAGMETYKSWCRCKGGTFEYSRTGSWCRFKEAPKPGKSSGAAAPGKSPSSDANAQTGQIFGAMQGLAGQLDQESRARRQRDAEDAARRKEREKEELERRGERLDELKGDLKDSGLDSSELDFKLDEAEGSFKLPNDKKSRSELKRAPSHAFTRGEDDAYGCFTSKGGPYCHEYPVDEQGDCFRDYKMGFASGEKKRTLKMRDAFLAGRKAKLDKLNLGEGSADPRAKGPCRTEWVQEFGRGYISK